MSDRVEQMFSNLRRGPWNVDPTAVPQEAPPGNGNPESTGWLSDDSVTADVIQANAVIAGKIDADAISAREIQADAVTASEIAANTITANEIAANTITANEIAANTITASEIAANTITASEIAADAITASELAANSVTAENITANTITASEIAASAITADELAANSVITSKIMAANVVSSKIELTISGKNYGANAGSVGAPGYFFDSDTATGLHWVGSLPIVGDIIGISVDGTRRAQFDVLGIGVNGNVEPTADATRNLGSSSNRWDVVYRVSESAVSDVNRKTDIADAPLGLDFIQSLQPRVFRWKDAADTQARESAVLDADGMARACAPHLRRIKRIRTLQQAGRVDDAVANAQVEQARAALTEIRHRYNGPVEEAQHKRRPGKRLHYGLIAQEVKAALDGAGVDSMDAAFWQESPEGDQSLSYTELIPILIRAIQEQQAQIDRLESHGPTSD